MRKTDTRCVQLPRHCHLGHLKRHVLGMPDHLCSDFDQLPRNVVSDKCFTDLGNANRRRKFPRLYNGRGFIYSRWRLVIFAPWNFEPELASKLHTKCLSSPVTHWVPVSQWPETLESREKHGRIIPLRSRHPGNPGSSHLRSECILAKELRPCRGYALEVSLELRFVGKA